MKIKIAGLAAFSFALLLGWGSASSARNPYVGPDKETDKLKQQAPATATAKAKAVGTGASFKGPLGLQLYSLRFEFQKHGWQQTLDWVRAQGFRLLEGGGTYGLTPAQFRAELDKRGLKMVSVFASFDTLRDKPDEAIAAAKAQGAEYVICGWIPHQGAFSAADVRKAAEVFNRAGAKIKAAGLQFCYHPHGYEFAPTGTGTLFDDLAAQTDAKVVSFELDVFWAIHGGQDPVQLLQKYPKRFALMHVKDLRKDVAGDLTGRAKDDTSVAIGAGKVAWAAVMKAAQKAGIKYYFIEDEAETAPEQIPLSLRYLERLRF